MRSRLWTIVGVVVASLLLGIGSSAMLYAVGDHREGPARGGWYLGDGGPYGPGMMGGSPTGSTCAAPELPGTVVDVTLGDMGAMMGARGNYRYLPVHRGLVRFAPSSVPAGQVSFRVTNSGWLSHELVVLPLPDDQQPGQRTIGSDDKVDENGSLGEASKTCGDGEGDGIAAGSTGWTTIDLPAGRYELVCNIAGHYRAGMYTELDVTSP